MPTNDELIKAIVPVQDPEIPISIVDLGLVYETTYDAATRKAHVKMTLTSLGCPAAGQIVAQVKGRVEELEEVDECEVQIVYSPAWKPQMASDRGKIQLQALGINV